MAAELFLTALITCTTGQALCTYHDLNTHKLVRVCGVLQDYHRESVSPDVNRSFRVDYEGEIYVVSISPFCESL